MEYISKSSAALYMNVFKDTKKYGPLHQCFTPPNSGIWHARWVIMRREAHGGEDLPVFRTETMCMRDAEQEAVLGAAVDLKPSLA